MICGHVHKPQNRVFTNEKGSILYLNSGDWVENLSALEYNNGVWDLMTFDETLVGEDFKLVKKNSLDNS
jgi:UDP-2,3-diacylglucosamine pyrophosphatase LpxH